MTCWASSGLRNISLNTGSARPQVIILDSHSSHETLGLIEAARENGIILFALPPHTTHWLLLLWVPFQWIKLIQTV